jgi:hypothetical protein
MPAGLLAKPRAEEIELVSRLKSLVHNRDSASLVGAAVLRCYSGPRTGSRIIRELVEGNDEFFSARSDKSLARSLRKSISRDFERGRIARVHGLVLAKTEASLCALIALDSRERA